jgi:hypothetical protein
LCNIYDVSKDNTDQGKENNFKHIISLKEDSVKQFEMLEVQGDMIEGQIKE